MKTTSVVRGRSVRGFGRVAGAIALTAGVVAAQEGARPPAQGPRQGGEAPREARGWAGAWLMDGQVVHEVARRGGGLVARIATSNGGALVLEGPDPGPDGALVLEAALPRTPGVVGVLEGRTAERPAARARLVARRAAPGPDGEDTAQVEVTLDGRALGAWRWTRPGPASLEVEVEGGAVNPKLARVFVRVRVRGRPQRVLFQVRLPEDPADERRRFYASRGLAGEVLATFASPGALPVGEHEVPWDGRDATRDRRILLAGTYRVVADSAEARAERGPDRAPPEARLEVDRPRAAVIAPDTFAFAPSIPSDDLLQHLPTRLARGGYDVDPTQRAPSPGSFADAMARAASVVLQTHGLPAETSLGLQPAGDEPAFTPASVPPRSLLDVHFVQITACLAGQRGPGGEDLPRALIAAGVDVVVTFDASVFMLEAAHLHARVGPRLLLQGMPIERALREAAAHASAYVWSRLGPEELREALAEGARPTFLSLRVDVAPGIDRATERLVPARHGAFTN